MASGSMKRARALERTPLPAIATRLVAAVEAALRRDHVNPHSHSIARYPIIRSIAADVKHLAPGR